MNEMWKLGVWAAMEKLALSKELLRRAATKRYSADMPTDVYRRVILSKHKSPRLQQRTKELTEKIRAGINAGAYNLGPRVHGGDYAMSGRTPIFAGGAIGGKKGGRGGGR